MILLRIMPASQGPNFVKFGTVSLGNLTKKNQTLYGDVQVAIFSVFYIFKSYEGHMT